MTEYWFYHLESAALEAVLPQLLEKTRAKGWRTLIKAPAERARQLDEYLWTYKDDSFLPHGLDSEPLADEQPVLITSDAPSSEGVACAFLLEGADIEPAEDTQRIIVLINGRDDAAITAARAQWSRLKKQDANLSYWQQDDRGGWAKKA